MTDYQSYKDWTGPANPDLSQIANSGREVLHEELYAYPQHQINYGTTFEQLRSGPNWQGNLMTLTTCKHLMRTSKRLHDWQGVWMAGFVPKSCTGDNHLLYMARIHMAFGHNYYLGQYLQQAHPDAYKAHSATLCPRGDIYPPRATMAAKLPAGAIDPRNYEDPIEGHTRWETDGDGNYKWKKDIYYTGYHNRMPVCFLMERPRTYLFQNPTYVSERPLHRSGYKTTVGEFLQHLRKVEWDQ